MKLIIQKTHGTIYAYREREAHHRRVEPERGTRRMDPEKLDHECDLSAYDNFHMVFDLKPSKRK